LIVGASALVSGFLGVLLWSQITGHRTRQSAVEVSAAPNPAAVIAGGLAMVPGYGIPFAFAPYLRDLVADSAARYGFDPDSSLLPIRILFTEAHLTEVWSVLLLIDGIGLLLCATAGWALWGRERAGGPDMKALLLDPAVDLARLDDFPMIDRPQTCRRCNFRRLCFPRPADAAEAPALSA